MKSLKIYSRMFALCVLPCLCAATLRARADITTITHTTMDMPIMHSQKITPAIKAMMDQYSNTTTYMSAHKTRVDNAAITMIMDMDAGKMIMLDPTRKTYTTTSLSPEDARKMMHNFMKSPAEGGSGLNVKVTDTGEITEILGYKARHYKIKMTMSMGNKPMHVTEDIFAAVGLSAFMPTPHTKMSGGSDLIKGLPLLTSMKTTGGPTGAMTMKMTVTSISTQPIPESTFAIPAGYTQAKAADANALGGMMPH